MEVRVNHFRVLLRQSKSETGKMRAHLFAPPSTRPRLGAKGCPLTRDTRTWTFPIIFNISKHFLATHEVSWSRMWGNKGKVGGATWLTDDSQRQVWSALPVITRRTCNLSLPGPNLCHWLQSTCILSVLVSLITDGRLEQGARMTNRTLERKQHRITKGERKWLRTSAGKWKRPGYTATEWFWL